MWSLAYNTSYLLFMLLWLLVWCIFHVELFSGVAHLVYELCLFGHCFCVGSLHGACCLGSACCSMLAWLQVWRR